MFVALQQECHSNIRATYAPLGLVTSHASLEACLSFTPSRYVYGKLPFAMRFHTGLPCTTIHNGCGDAMLDIRSKAHRPATNDRIGTG